MKSRRTPAWLSRLVVEAIHFDQTREHGGLHGLRDEGLLESTLAKPKHRWSFDEDSDVADLAAAYGYGIARNHPFHDGNKRTAFLAMVTLFGLNDIRFEAEEADVVTTMLLLASGRCSEAELAGWLRNQMSSQ